MVRLEIEVLVRISGKESEILVKTIIPENRKYIKFRKVRDGYVCHIKGDTNNVRKTINEFLESLIFVEKVAMETDARVG